MPLARVGRHFKHPDAGGDPPEARMADKVIGRTGLHDDEIGAATDAEVFEPVVGCELLPYLIDLAVFCENLGHRSRGGVMPPECRPPSFGSP